MRTAKRPEIWAFDVDGCLVDLLGGASLRPFARELLGALRARGTVAELSRAAGLTYLPPREPAVLGDVLQQILGK